MYAQDLDIPGQIQEENNNRTTIINVIVDARRQFDSALDLDNIILKDNNQNAVSGTGIQTYISQVYADAMVIWIIRVSKQSVRMGYSAELTQVEMKNEANCIFGETKIPGNGKILMAQVTGDGKCKQEEYTVKFLLRNSDGDIRTFEFDPILKPNN